MLDSWRAYGWTLTDEKRTDEADVLDLSQKQADLAISVGAGKGGISIMIQSGCVKPDGTVSASPTP
jgi:hypothetical protein